MEPINGSASRPLKRARGDDLQLASPTNNLTTPLLTDMYQVWMSIAFELALVIMNDMVYLLVDFNDIWLLEGRNL